MAVVVECVACKTLHTLADREAAGETWCSGCGSLLHSDRPVPELVHETRHLACDRPLLSPGFGRRAWQKVATRPASVNVAIGAAILMFVVEVAAALRRTGPSLPLQQVLFSHLTVIAVIIFGLILRSRLVWAMARIMGAVGAFLLGQMALWEHSRHWGSAPPIADLALAWGLLALRCVPPLVVFAALGRPAAREYFGVTCPECQSSQPIFRGFRGKRAVCENCGHAW